MIEKVPVYSSYGGMIGPDGTGPVDPCGSYVSAFDYQCLADKYGQLLACVRAADAAKLSQEEVSALEFPNIPDRLKEPLKFNAWLYARGRMHQANLNYDAARMALGTEKL